jgi:hypothetical protein
MDYHKKYFHIIFPPTLIGKFSVVAKRRFKLGTYWAKTAADE